MVQTYEIRLEMHGLPITVSAEGRSAIETLAWSYAVCENGGHPYTQDNPRIGRNCCLHHYLEEARSLKSYIRLLRQVGEHESEHVFVDYLGFIHVSSTKNNEPYKSVYETMRYYGFTPLQEFQLDATSAPLQLEPYFWNVYGDVQTRPVVIAVYKKETPTPSLFEFLCVKDGPTLPISRRRGILLHLWREAKRQIEASHDKDGYHWKETTFSQVFESRIYTAASDIASEQYDAQEAKLLTYIRSNT